MIIYYCIVDHCSSTGKEFTQYSMQLLWFVYVVCLHVCVYDSTGKELTTHHCISYKLILHLCSDLSSVSDVDLNDSSLT